MIFPTCAPNKINFKTGGYITGDYWPVLIMPWKLIADPNGYIFTWLTCLFQPVGAGGWYYDCRLFLYSEEKIY